MDKLVQTHFKVKSKCKHKAKNNPKPTVDDICTVCGRPYAELHEVFFGPYRQLSIKYGLQERLCADHHKGPTGPIKTRQEIRNSNANIKPYLSKHILGLSSWLSLMKIICSAIYKYYEVREAII